MESCEDHFKRRLVLKLWVRVDGNSAAVIVHRHRTIFAKFDVDPARVASHGFVHCIVDDFSS